MLYEVITQTRILLTPSENSQQGGLVIYADDDSYVRLTYAFIDGPVFEFAEEVGGDFQSIQVPAPLGINDFHILLARSGLEYRITSYNVCYTKLLRRNLYHIEKVKKE